MKKKSTKIPNFLCIFMNPFFSPYPNYISQITDASLFLFYIYAMSVYVNTGLYNRVLKWNISWLMFSDTQNATTKA